VHRRSPGTAARLTAAALMLAGAIGSAQQQGYTGSSLDVSVVPGVAVPVGQGRELFTAGPSALLAARYRVPGAPLLDLGAEAGYAWLPVRAQNAVSLLLGGAGAGLSLDPVPRLSTALRLTGGYAAGFLPEGPLVSATELGGSAYLRATTTGSWFLSPSWSLQVQAGCTLVFGLLPYVEAGLGAGYHLPRRGRGALSIQAVAVSKLFPAQFELYAQEAPGVIVVKNDGRFPVEELRASIFVPEYMAQPTPCKAPARVGSGEVAEILPRLAFNDRVLGLIEGRTLPANLSIEYECAGKQGALTHEWLLETYDRNALVWDDDRKAALFVSARDPVVLELAGRSAAAVRAAGLCPLDIGFRLAAAVHSALAVWGMSYAADPLSPYAEARSDRLRVDFLKFPRQTMKQGAGDCDDLTVLYCAVLESIGRRTAFLTVPGHILPAVALALTPEEARRDLTHFEDLIEWGKEVWLPVEITEIEGGFLRAWQAGARLYREHEARGEARLYPLRECWKSFPPVSLAEGDIGIVCPEPERIRGHYEVEMARVVERELEPKAAELRRRIEAGGGGPSAWNSLGVLYARYGMYEQAREQFERAAKEPTYVPALVNLGNLALICERWGEALLAFQRAAERAPDSTFVLLGLARACYGLERHAEVRRHYDRLKAVDPELAGRFAFLVVSRKGEDRATLTSGLDPQVLWEDE